MAAAQAKCDTCHALASITTKGVLRSHRHAGQTCSGSGQPAGPAPSSQVDRAREPQAANMGVDRGRCRTCGHWVQVMKNGKLKYHQSGVGRPSQRVDCPGSYQDVPYDERLKWRERQERIEENRRTMNPATGAGAVYADVDDPELESRVVNHSEYDQASNPSATPARPVETAHPTTPVRGAQDTIPALGAHSLFSQPEPVADVDDPVEDPQPATEDRDCAFVQPGYVKRASKRERIPLTGDALALKERMREIFWWHVNRSRRSVQKEIGPSEIGAECDRRLAAKLAGVTAVNHPNDGYAAWKGTQVHRGIEDMLREYDAGRGRFLVDWPVQFSDELMPHGHLDQADRVLMEVQDNKFVGRSTMSKLWLDGQPSRQYQVQLHAYGYGLRMQGERVDKVALVAWPADSNSLDDMWTWVAPLDEQVARDALNRLHGIDDQLKSRAWWAVAAQPGYYCAYCPFYRPGANTNISCGGNS